MRLAIVVPTFPQASETFIASKVSGLASRGVDVHVVCQESPEATWAALGLDEALRPRVHVVPSGRSPRQLLATLAQVGHLVRHGPADAARATRRARSVGAPLGAIGADAALVAIAPDVVHFEFGALAPQRLYLKALLGCRLTVSFRGYDLAYAGLEDDGFYTRLWAEVDRVHLLGDGLWQRARHRGAPDDLPRALIPPAIDPSRFAAPPVDNGPIGMPDRPVRLVSVGRLHWTKGYEHALEAVARLRADGATLQYRIVGDGPYLDAVSFWRHQLGLDDCVELCRSATPDEVAAHLGWCDIFLHAAVSEGFGNAVLEAQAAGRPVVATDADGLIENVDNGVTGYVVPRRDPAALHAALNRLVADADERVRLGAAGPGRVREKFALADHLDAWEAFYQTTMETRR